MADSHPIPIPSRVQDLTGKVFGLLTVLSFVELNRHHKAVWLCRCECGQTQCFIGAGIRSGNTRSCGCRAGRLTEDARGKWLRRRLTDDVSRTDTGCWEWLGTCGSDGYGRITVNGRQSRAHIESYRLFCGPIPDGLWVLHRCDNPPCINPEHLFVGSVQDNVDDMFAKGRANKAAGESHGSSKLTRTQVDTIRKAYAKGGISQRVLGLQFGVTQANIWHIVNGTSWTRGTSPAVALSE